jgi:NTP pyrophosphatase (non-canonical NTP hydrolase)
MMVLLPFGSIRKIENSMALDPINTHSNLPLGKLQEEVHEWIANHGVRYFNELTNMAQLTEEVGEVARIIARRYGEQSEKESDKAKDLGEELSDVLFVVLCLANQTGTDLQAAFDKKMNVKRERDHDRHHNNEKLK